MFAKLRRLARVAPMGLWFLSPSAFIDPSAFNVGADYRPAFDGTRFHQPEPITIDLADRAKRTRTANRGPWREFTDTPPGPAPAALVCDRNIRVTFVNHATLLIQMDGVNILTDPTWARRSVPRIGRVRHRPPGLRFEELPPIDAVLVSHNHHDHMDIPTLRRLAQEFQPTVYAGLRSGVFLARKGVSGAHDLGWWESSEIAPGVTVTAVPARHHSNRSLFDKNRMLWCGFVVSGPSGSVYFAGDTGWGRHFAEIGRRFPNLSVALLPIGGYSPVWYMREQHIGPEDALRAFQDLGAETMIPMHFGTFPNGNEAELEPVLVLEATLDAEPALRGKVVILDNGQSVDFPPAWLPETVQASSRPEETSLHAPR